MNKIMDISNNDDTLVEQYKQELIDATDISSSQEEMDVIDKVLVRFLKLGWLKKLESYRTLELRPVVHGKWILNKDGSGTCSQCNYTQLHCWDLENWDNFCHHCGADMRDYFGPEDN